VYQGNAREIQLS